MINYGAPLFVPRLPVEQGVDNSYWGPVSPDTQVTPYDYDVLNRSYAWALHAAMAFRPGPWQVSASHPMYIDHFVEGQANVYWRTMTPYAAGPYAGLSEYKNPILPQDRQPVGTPIVKVMPQPDLAWRYPWVPGSNG